MRRLLLPVLLLALAAPAAAGSPAAVEDPCGDADPWLDSYKVVVSANERAAPFDVRRAEVRDLREDGEVVGVEVVLDLCGDVPAPELPGTGWRVSWELPPQPGGISCTGSVRVQDVLTGSGVVRQALLGESCARPAEGPLFEGGVESSPVYDVPLDTWSVEGSRLTWRLSGDLGPAADRLAPGTFWGGVRAATSDGRRVVETEATVGDVLLFRGGGAGSSDRTARGGDFTVG